MAHWSDCAVNNMPAYPAEKCGCGDSAYSHRRLHCPTPFSTWAAHASINSPRRTKKSVLR